MSSNHDDHLKGIINASGFLFQLAIEHQIKKTKNVHGWEIWAHEHPWYNSENNSEGYIDLILKKNRVRMVIECKLQRGGTWIFLNPERKNDSVKRSKYLWANIKRVAGALFMPTLGSDRARPVYKSILGWSDLSMSVESPEVEFCKIESSKGKDNKENPFLERISSQLIKATECLAYEELEMNKNKECEDVYFYIPAIITTAALQVCTFDPDKISISDGLLSEGVFKAVPFIRFRKSLSTQSTSSNDTKDLPAANRDKERTILIINADSLCNVLDDMKIDKLDRFEPWPWENYKE
jgi:hypothetical protein